MKIKTLTEDKLGWLQWLVLKGMTLIFYLVTSAASACLHQIGPAFHGSELYIIVLTGLYRFPLKRTIIFVCVKIIIRGKIREIKYDHSICQGNTLSTPWTQGMIPSSKVSFPCWFEDRGQLLTEIYQFLEFRWTHRSMGQDGEEKK